MIFGATDRRIKEERKKQFRKHRQQLKEVANKRSVSAFLIHFDIRRRIYLDWL